MLKVPYSTHHKNCDLRYGHVAWLSQYSTPLPCPLLRYVESSEHLTQLSRKVPLQRGQVPSARKLEWCGWEQLLQPRPPQRPQVCGRRRNPKSTTGFVDCGVVVSVAGCSGVTGSSIVVSCGDSDSVMSPVDLALSAQPTRKPISNVASNNLEHGIVNRFMRLLPK